MINLLIIFAVINLFAFIRIGFDKKVSVKNENPDEKDKQRISEVGIITVAALGGALGTYLAFEFFKHKTSVNKKYLRINLYLILFQNVVMWGALVLTTLRIYF